ncbi:MAG TPA: acyl-ACP desaturase [Candidatus Binataceae bacterium]|nr:acyl-ACP desaturase [Candidatus Binataceae bacterium]
MSASAPDSVYQLYLDFLETAETKRRWSIFGDIPWDKLDASKATETEAQRVEIYCTEELYVPDYTSNALELVRSGFGPAWFQICWAFEESKHGLVFREYLTRSGLRTEAEFAALQEGVSARPWSLPFSTLRQMNCYGALQEGATYTAYKVQKDQTRVIGDKVLEAIFSFVGRDEAAHAGWYRAMIGLNLVQDRDGTIADLAYVLSNFKMPGDGLIPNYKERLQTSGAGISPRMFIEGVVHPLLTTLEISRGEFKLALKKAASTTNRHVEAAPLQ